MARVFEEAGSWSVAQTASVQELLSVEPFNGPKLTMMLLGIKLLKVTLVGMRYAKLLPQVQYTTCGPVVTTRS